MMFLNLDPAAKTFCQIPSLRMFHKIVPVCIMACGISHTNLWAGFNPIPRGEGRTLNTGPAKGAAAP